MFIGGGGVICGKVATFSHLYRRSSLKLFHQWPRYDGPAHGQELSPLVQDGHVLVRSKRVIAAHNVFAKYGPARGDELRHSVDHRDRPAGTRTEILASFHHPPFVEEGLCADQRRRDAPVGTEGEKDLSIGLFQHVPRPTSSG